VHPMETKDPRDGAGTLTLTLRSCTSPQPTAGATGILIWPGSGAGRARTSKPRAARARQAYRAPHQTPSGLQPIATQDHRNMDWFGLEGTLQTISFQPLTMGTDPFHQTRVLQAPSNLALSTAREGAATVSLGSLRQGLTVLRVENFFLTSNLYLLSFSLKPSPLVLLQQHLLKSLSPTFLLSRLLLLAAALRSPWCLLFPRLSSPSSPSLSSQQRGSSPSDHCWGFLWPSSNSSMSFLCWRPQSYRFSNHSWNFLPKSSPVSPSAI